MRNLTIKRTKSFVACLAKMKVYIEDQSAGDTTINNTPCRKLGNLKNGEEKTFQIENESAKIFVIADQISKSFCCEYYQLPEGEDDVFLTGKNKFNPSTGNAFRFDNNDSEDVVKNRKRNVKRGIIVLVAALIIGWLIGYISVNSVMSPKPETFTSDGMTVTLTDKFTKADFDNFTVGYESKNAAVFALKEPFSLFEGFEEYTVKEYADLVIAGNELDSVEAKTDDGLTYFEYVGEVSGDTFHYFAYVFKTDDSFWLVQFATLDSMAQAYSERITEWAKSVKFDN